MFINYNNSHYCSRNRQVPSRRGRIHPIGVWVLAIDQPYLEETVLLSLALRFSDLNNYQSGQGHRTERSSGPRVLATRPLGLLTDDPRSRYSPQVTNSDQPCEELAVGTDFNGCFSLHPSRKSKPPEINLGFGESFSESVEKQATCTSRPTLMIVGKPVVPAWLDL